VQADKDTLAALQAIPGYKTTNPLYALDKVEAALAAYTQASEVQTQAAYEAARTAVYESERRFHELILGVKEQVIAPFGGNSNEVAAVGLKKKSEYKRPNRRQPKPKEL